MIDLIKKSLLAGVGAAVVTKEVVEESLAQFVKEGKVSAADAKIMAEKLSEQGRREFDEICAKVGAKMRDATARAEEKTHARLSDLEQRLHAIEAKLTAPATRAGEP